MEKEIMTLNERERRCVEYPTEGNENKAWNLI